MPSTTLRGSVFQRRRSNSATSALRQSGHLPSSCTAFERRCKWPARAWHACANVTRRGRLCHTPSTSGWAHNAPCRVCRATQSRICEGSASQLLAPNSPTSDSRQCCFSVLAYSSTWMLITTKAARAWAKAVGHLANTDAAGQGQKVAVESLWQVACPA